MRNVGAGHLAFAATLIAIGLVSLLKADFFAIWEPVPKETPAREVLVYLCGLVSLVSGVGLLWRRAAAVAALVLLVWLVFWVLLIRAPVIFRAPTVAVSWESCAEIVVLVAGAWVLCAWFPVRIARVLYGLALIPLGLAHFAYSKQTAALVPVWLPSQVFWVYLTGSTYILAGVSLLVGVFARLAAGLSALQMGGFTLLVWVPVVAAAGHKDNFQWSETAVSFALTAAAWVVADSFRDRPVLTTG